MAAWVQFSKFYTSMEKHKWPFGRSFQNFVFRCKKRNGRLGTVFKILHFAVKNELPFWYNCKILYFPVKKTTGRLGTRIRNNFKSFVFCSQRTNDSLGTTVKSCISL